MLAVTLDQAAANVYVNNDPLDPEVTISTLAVYRKDVSSSDASSEEYLIARVNKETGAASYQVRIHLTYYEAKAFPIFSKAYYISGVTPASTRVSVLSSTVSDTCNILFCSTGTTLTFEIPEVSLIVAAEYTDAKGAQLWPFRIRSPDDREVYFSAFSTVELAALWKKVQEYKSKSN